MLPLKVTVPVLALNIADAPLAQLPVSDRLLAPMANVPAVLEILPVTALLPDVVITLPDLLIVTFPVNAAGHSKPVVSGPPLPKFIYVRLTPE